MGTWGTSPFENDEGLDFLTHLINEEPVKKLVNKKKLDGYEYHELLAATAVLLHLHKINNLWFKRKTVEKMVWHFEKMLEDSEWFDSWTRLENAETVKSEVKRNIEQLNILLIRNQTY